MDIENVRAMLAEQCAAAGGMRAWARAHGVTGALVSAVLLGKREPGPAILAVLGVERVVTYRKARTTLAP